MVGELAVKADAGSNWTNDCPMAKAPMATTANSAVSTFIVIAPICGPVVTPKHSDETTAKVIQLRIKSCKAEHIGLLRALQ